VQTTVKMDIVPIPGKDDEVALAVDDRARQYRWVLKEVVGELPTSRYTVVYKLDPVGDYCIYMVPGFHYPMLARCQDGQVPTRDDLVQERVRGANVCFLPHEWDRHRVTRTVTIPSPS